jgi:hypothetical protein
MELAAHVGVDGTLVPGPCWDAGRSDHADGCQALGRGCSKRMGIGPLPVGVSKKSPWRLVLEFGTVENFDFRIIDSIRVID